MPSFRSSVGTVLGTFALLTASGCHDDRDLVSAPDFHTIQAADPAYRGPKSFEILWALQDAGRTDGTLLVGLKESFADRGVALDGRPLPVPARLAAEAAIRASVPGLTVVNGVVRVVPRHMGDVVLMDTLVRTFLRVKPELSETALDRLRSHPNVDYIEPNYTNGTLNGGASIVGVSMAESRPWSIDTVRAASAWSLGYTGGSVPIGMADTGFDMAAAGFSGGHPDIWFNSAFYNLVYERSDNRCSGSFYSPTPCYWEEPYHGMGVLGSAIATANTQGSVGIAPSTGGGAYIVKPFYVSQGGGFQLPIDVFADAVQLVSSLLGEHGIAVTSLGYTATDTLFSVTLGNAFRTAYEQGNVLWFAAAGNSSGLVGIPAAYESVVAVGALDRVNGKLVRRFNSPIDPRLELTAPGSQLSISWNRAEAASGVATKENTSFAAPIALAVARIAKQAHPSWTAAQLRQKLRDHARDLGPTGKDNEFGWGMVDAHCIVHQLTPCTR